MPNHTQPALRVRCIAALQIMLCACPLGTDTSALQGSNVLSVCALSAPAWMTLPPPSRPGSVLCVGRGAHARGQTPIRHLRPLGSPADRPRSAVSGCRCACCALTAASCSVPAARSELHAERATPHCHLIKTFCGRFTLQVHIHTSHDRRPRDSRSGTQTAGGYMQLHPTAQADLAVW